MDEHKDNLPNKSWEHLHSTKGRIFSGFLVVAVGVVLLLKQLGFWLPQCLFTWEMLLIVIGLYTGFKHNFKRPGWIILIFVGLLFMVDDVFPGVNIEAYFWPIAIIFMGVVMITTAGKRKERWKNWRDQCRKTNSVSTSENMLDVISVLGGVKKNVITKDFKGGEITCVMGGAEINLSQADFEGKVILEITQVFGGTALIIPANWEVQSESTAILGGIEDKRAVNDMISNGSKILVLKGVTVFGGIEIKNY
jgi:predicted membrane protein